MTLVFLVIVALVSVMPIYFLVVSAFKSSAQYGQNLLGLPTHPTLGNFSAAWKQASIGLYMKNSLIVSVGTVLVCVATAVGIAFALTFLRWPGRRLVYWTCLALLAVPPLTLMVPVYEVLVQLGVVDTRVGITLLYSAFSIPFAVYLLVSYMRTLPKEVIEAAVLDGTPVLRLAWEVVLPLTTPAIATAAVLTFLFAWNEVIYAFLVLQSNGNRTLAAGLTGLIGRYYTNFPILLAGLLLSVLPVGAVYVYFQRYLVSGIAVGVE